MKLVLILIPMSLMFADVVVSNFKDRTTNMFAEDNSNQFDGKKFQFRGIPETEMIFFLYNGFTKKIACPFFSKELQFYDISFYYEFINCSYPLRL